MDDRTNVKIDMNKMASVSVDGRAGVSVMPLFEDHRESVQLETWAPGARISIDLPEGGEFLVLEGGFETGDDQMREQSWLRMPIGTTLEAMASNRGAKVWMKRRHLRFVAAPDV